LIPAFGLITGGSYIDGPSYRHHLAQQRAKSPDAAPAADPAESFFLSQVSDRYIGNFRLSDDAACAPQWPHRAE